MRAVTMNIVVIHMEEKVHNVVSSEQSSEQTSTKTTRFAVHSIRRYYDYAIFRTFVIHHEFPPYIEYICMYGYMDIEE